MNMRNLAVVPVQMVEDEEDFVVQGCKAGDGITRSVLMKIIREQANDG
jgi:polyhydroxyalkanoate synthesis regulator protein